MKKNKKNIKVAVLDDSDFYRGILVRELENYSKVLSLNSDLEFNIVSFSTTENFYDHLSNDLNIAFVDYYLDHGNRASSVIKKIKDKASDCRIIIVSQAPTIRTAITPITQGAHAFIHKDRRVLDEVCFQMEKQTMEFINAKNKF